MKNYKSYFTLILAAFTIFFTACSDEYMENMNTDPSKASTIDPNAQLTTAQLQTYGDLGMVEIYRNYLYAFNQQLMGCWNTTNYGGRHTVDNNEMGRIWTTFYTTAIKHLTDAQNRTDDNDEKEKIRRHHQFFRRIQRLCYRRQILFPVPSSKTRMPERRMRRSSHNLERFCRIRPFFHVGNRRSRLGSSFPAQSILPFRQTVLRNHVVSFHPQTVKRRQALPFYPGSIRRI